MKICQKSPRYSVKACPKYVERAMSKEPYTLSEEMSKNMSSQET